MHEAKKKQRVISLIRELDAFFLPLVLVKNLLEAVIPYLNILLPSFIVNLLYEQASAAEIFTFLLVFFLVLLAVRLLFFVLKRQLEIKKNCICNAYSVKKIEKIFYVQFDHLETAAFEKILQGIRYNDEMFGAFQNYMEELEKICRSVFQIVTALGIFIWMTMSVAQAALAKELSMAVCGLLGGTLLSVALMVLIQRAVNQKMPALMDKIVDINTIFMVLYEDVVQNYQKGKDVRLFGMDRLIVDEGEKMIAGFAPHAKKQIWLSQAAGMAGSILSLVIGGISFVVMGSFALKGAIAPGNVISFAGSVQQLSTAVIGIAFSFGSLNLWNVRMDAAFELFGLKEERDTAESGDTGGKLYALENIAFDDVSFRYPEGEEDILKHVSLTIERGEKIAVVGPNGSGKSTFIKLLCGLYQPTGGRILINGRDRAELSFRQRRECFAAVYQDFTLFSFTVGENIVLGEVKDTEKMERVFQRLKLNEKVERMKQGADTYLYQDYGEEGREVSGGEAQKLAICRALYRDTSFVVLDEPTAALDPVSEYEIYKDFQMLVEDKTAVFVSHRLSSCRFCERIFVFARGTLVQQGSHAQLLAEPDGLYRTLWDAQAQYYVTES